MGDFYIFLPCLPAGRLHSTAVFEKIQTKKPKIKEAPMSGTSIKWLINKER